MGVFDDHNELSVTNGNELPRSSELPRENCVKMVPHTPKRNQITVEKVKFDTAEEWYDQHHERVVHMHSVCRQEYLMIFKGSYEDVNAAPVETKIPTRNLLALDALETLKLDFTISIPQTA